MIEHFRQYGFTRVEGLLSKAEFARIEAAHGELITRAESLLKRALDAGQDLGKTYSKDKPELIVVPERDDPAKVCRMEYMMASHPEMKKLVQEKLEPAVSQVAGRAFTLFKDKCNEKRPGGGAYPPHQDFPAYMAFKPRYHITAMVALDSASSENGCLSFATNFQEVVKANGTFVTEWVGGNPMVGYYDGGPHNGDILTEISREFDWKLIEAQAGDVLLFDSFVPHFSPPNQGSRSRRAMFFTHNAASEGDWYESYYATKREQYYNPMFHIATPTQHDKLESVG